MFTFDVLPGDAAEVLRFVGRWRPYLWRAIQSSWNPRNIRIAKYRPGGFGDTRPYRQVRIDKSEVPDDYVVMAIQIPSQQVSRQLLTRMAGVGQLTAEAFRRRFYPHPALRVPSVIVPREYNFVLLPEFEPDAVIKWIEPLDFDRRLFAVAAL